MRLEVTDVAGATATATATVRVGTAPPVPEIATPAPGSAVAVGERVEFSGGATVDGVGELPPSALSWAVDLLHCTTIDECHRHPDVYALEGAASGSFVMPDHEYPAYVELHLSATWDGETATATRRIDYRTVEVALTADTPGAELTLAGVTAPTIVSRALPEGATVAVSAAADVTNDAGTFAFASWSDGGARTHEIVVPADPLELTAHYEPVPAPGSG